MKLYDKVKEILESNPETRDSDNKLIWEVWRYLDLTNGDMIDKWDFMKAPASESITRARRKIQELHPHLRATKVVQEARKEKQEEKGTFIFREQLKL